MSQTGSIPSQLIREMIGAGYIKSQDEIFIQPASIDLSISDEIYEMKGSYLPQKGESLRSIIAHGSVKKHSIKDPFLAHTAYLVRLRESLALPPLIHACASNKSSSGRINLRARLLADGVSQFDHLPIGYKGELWVEVITK